MNAHRAALAKEVNNVLSKCISTSHAKDSWAMSLLKCLKDGLDQEHIFQIVELAQLLDDYIILPRTAKFLNEKAKSSSSQQEVDGSDDSSMTDAPNFASFEKSLW